VTCNPHPHHSRRCLLFLLGSVILLAGCQSTTPLMPTPNLYAWNEADPFSDVPPALQNNHVDVLYLTDRCMQPRPNGDTEYGHARSRSVAYGVAEVNIGKNVSWDDLVKASRSSFRLINMNLTMGKITEMGQFPPTPRSLLEVRPPTTLPTTRLCLPGEINDAPEVAAEADFQRQLSAQLALSPVKEVYLFVHGYANTFDDSVQTIAQLWHFLGRQGVPVAYSWPAGGGGLLRGYTYDTGSSEFTVFHLEQMLRIIANNPDVKKVNIICHSRGTETTISALRDLHIEISASGNNTRDVLKLGTLVLAAPDIDLDVVIQKMLTVRLGKVPERSAMYINPSDKALGLSSWLFGGIARLGGIHAGVFSPAELTMLRGSKTFSIVDAHVIHLGFFGHDYFHSNPAVSSDLILLMRYHLPPGAQYGRPLNTTESGFWSVDDKYPQASPELTAATADNIAAQKDAPTTEPATTVPLTNEPATSPSTSPSTSP
jgi:esterase/lipase superfamily enzyme